LLCALASVLFFQFFTDYQLNRPGQLVDRAISLENAGQIEDALAVYAEVSNTYSDTPLAEIALYNSALIWQYRLQDNNQALLLYLRLEYLYPDSKYLFLSRKEAAWIVKYSMADYYQAIGYYQRLYATVDDTHPVNEYFLYELADCYFRLENYSQARLELESLLDNHPESKLRALVLNRIGELSFLEGQVNSAKEYWQQVISEFPESSYSEDAKFNLARLEEENQNLKKALQAYQSLKNNSQHDMVENKIQHLKKRITEKNKVIE
jgi:TolA-binding protein